MAWSAPMTFVGNTVLSAANLNTYLRDNLSQLAPAKATTANRIFVSTGTNAIAERAYSTSQVSATQTRSATGYGDLATAGPSVTVTTGTQALVGFSCFIFNSSSADLSNVSFAVSGATTISPGDDGIMHMEILGSQSERVGVIEYVTGLTAGSNTFTLKYSVGSGFAPVGTGSYGERHIWVIGL